MSDVDLLPVGARKPSAELEREATITIRLHAPTPGRIGPVLDELMPLLREITAVLAQGGVTADVTLPGYSKVFYGHESVEDGG